MKNIKTNKKIIIFDMDGVLFDSIKIARDSILAGHPGMTEEMLKEVNTGNFYEGMKKYAHLKKEQTEEEKEEHKIAYSLKKSEALMYKGTKSLLENLHNMGYLLVLNTSAYDRNCLPLLERNGIKYIFDLIGTAELSKNKAEKFEIIKDKYNIKKKNLLFVTDALGDVKEAGIAGIPTVAVTWGMHDKSYFNREKHSYLISIVESVKELQDFILKHFNNKRNSY